MKKRLLAVLSAFVLIANNILIDTVSAEQVTFNPSTHKVHKATCPSAKRCKKCTNIERKIAYSKGGKPCKKCGG